jgi:hypothetical protein
MHATPGGG